MRFLRSSRPGGQLTALFFFAQGAIDPDTGARAPNRREYDFDVTYRAAGVLRGLSIRFRLGFVDERGVDGLLPDVRLILNYEIPLL